MLPKKIKRLPTKRSMLWWGIGFASAFFVLFLVVLSMAGVVYSELPQKPSLSFKYQVDAIVCLTGGKGRIRYSLDLYDKGFGRMLYISGTDPNVGLGQILREFNSPSAVDEKNIILDNVSTNTIQNAMQVRRFIWERQIRSVLVVTSSYHVRRAHYIFKKLLPPEVHLEMSWFEREPFDESDWWKDPNGIWVTVSEFFKFFVAYLKLG